MRCKKIKPCLLLILVIFAISFLFIITSIVFGSLLFFRNFIMKMACDYCLLYEMSIVFSTLGFGIATLGISLMKYRNDVIKSENREEQLIANCRENYSKIVSTDEYRFIKEIYDSIFPDYIFDKKVFCLDSIENEVKNSFKNSSDEVIFIECIRSCLYLLPNENIKRIKREHLDISLVTITASSIRSLLSKFSTITSFYMNGHLNDEDFEYEFLDGIMSVHLMAVIIQDIFSFYCENIKVRLDLNAYFENKAKNIERGKKKNG